MPFAEAGAVDISMQYRPDNPGDGFENTTPLSGYCVEFGGCASGEASVALPVRYVRQVTVGLPPLPSRWSLKVPAQAQVTLFSDNGTPLTVDFQVTHVAQLLSGSGFTRYENPAFHWSTGGGCNFVTSQAFDGGAITGFVWQVSNPLAPSLCYPTSGGVSEGEHSIEPHVHAFSIGYRLRLPQGHAIPMGHYTGSLTWSVGEAGDMALGAQVSGLSHTSVTLDFAVQVEHELSVSFDTANPQVDLTPLNGTWAQWMMTGAPADAQLAGQLPLRISTTGPFALYLECEHGRPAGDCALANARTGELAVISTHVSLPQGLVYQGAPVHKLRLAEHVRYPLDTQRTIVAERGAVEFNTGDGEVRQMIEHNGDTYAGQVTLYFDARLL